MLVLAMQFSKGLERETAGSERAGVLLAAHLENGRDDGQPNTR